MLNVYRVDLHQLLAAQHQDSPGGDVNALAELRHGADFARYSRIAQSGNFQPAFAQHLLRRSRHRIMEAGVEAKGNRGGTLSHDHRTGLGSAEFRERRKLQEGMEGGVRIVQQFVRLVSQFIRPYDPAAESCAVFLELGNVDSLQVNRLNVLYHRPVGRLSDLEPTVPATKKSSDISGVSRVSCMNANHVLGYRLAYQS